MLLTNNYILKLTDNLYLLIDLSVIYYFSSQLFI